MKLRSFLSNNGVTASGGLGILTLMILRSQFGLQLTELEQLAVVAVVLAGAKAAQALLQRKGILPVAAALLALMASPVAEASGLRSTLLTETASVSQPYVGPDGVVDPNFVNIYQQERGVLYLDLAVSLDFFAIDLDSREYELGVTPGVGYGVFWAPSWWTLSESFLAFNVFVSGGAVAVQGLGDSAPDIFAVDLLPTVIIGNLFGVGFGMRAKVGLRKDVPDQISPIFTFGMRTSI